jgi:predicted ribosome quality control (RQC) complex YloA/Tae2 family protein
MAELSGFEVLVLVKEISSTLRGAYINNIYSFGQSQILRFRKPDTGDQWLLVFPKFGVWISTMVTERAETTEFTSKLRGHLGRARLAGASQVDLDRVYEIEFDGDDKMKLVVELMPPGNIIVLAHDGRIQLALLEVRSARRRVVRGELYVPPAQSRLSPAKVGVEEVEKMIRSESTVGRAIGRHVALPRKYVAETLARLKVSDGDPSSSLHGREGEVIEALGELIREADEEPRPCICSTPAGDDIYAVPPVGLKVVVRGDTVSELCDRLLLQAAGEMEIEPSPEEEKKRELEATIANLRSRTGSLLVEAEKFRSAAKKAAGSTLDEALKILKEIGEKSVRDPGTPASAASILFDRAKSLEAESKEAETAAAKLERKVPKNTQRRQREGRPLLTRRQEWYEKFRWFFTSEGKLAVGGRDAQTNAALIGRHMEQNDTVYHADLFGSPFFVLKGGAAQSRTEEREVATATVSFSSAWKTGLGSADAFWVQPSQVSAAAPSGEYLPRGSFFIRGKKNFVNRNIVEVAIGIEGSGRLMAGPEGAIRVRCERYVVLTPHREKPSDTAKRVLKELTPRLNPSQALALDDVVRALPPGGGKIVRRNTKLAEEEKDD